LNPHSCSHGNSSFALEDPAKMVGRGSGRSGLSIQPSMPRPIMFPKRISGTARPTGDQSTLTAIERYEKKILLTHDIVNGKVTPF